MIHIDNTYISLVKDINREYSILSPNSYHPFSPADPHMATGHYSKLNFRKKDNIGYIKHKYNNLWLFDTPTGPVFAPPQQGDYYKMYPGVYWIEYLNEYTFLIYKPLRYGDKRIFFLKYKHVKDEIHISWEKDLLNATIFTYDYVPWKDFLNHGRFSSYKYHLNTKAMSKAYSQNWLRQSRFTRLTSFAK
uniref:Uncharacterized protein n=1 Tax=Mimivirus LCMiAC01 TaxID=2506608 RepID=A0A481YZD3_9VIRU|nr:MAG: hypothetical protein LCMiAC01_02450 [Mimivirus LCMiAC01]